MVTITVKNISEVLEEISKKKLEIISIKKEKIIQNLIEKLKSATPVDTGRARDGWIKNGDSIENNVPYIDYLNEGSSKQAPSHFIEKTLLAQPGIKPRGIIVKSK